MERKSRGMWNSLSFSSVLCRKKEIGGRKAIGMTERIFYRRVL